MTKFQVNAENGIANIGNLYGIKQVMKKALQGETCKIGFLGGSITQGSLSSLPTTCYAYLVFEWWKKTFCKANFVYINAGIGGTTSEFGVARVQEDLLEKQPDFTIVEFSVNDDNEEHFQETYEGLVRKIDSSESKPAILLVHNVRYDDGGNAQEQHSKVGKHYNLPCVSMQSSIYKEVEAGHINKKDITPDDLHPNDAGHELVASVIIHFLEKVLSEITKEEMPILTKVNPLTKNQYEHSTRFRNDNTTPVLNGFRLDERKQEGITDTFKRGWEASELGASILFEIEGTGVAVQFRKSVLKPTPIAFVVVDDDYENAVTLDGNFKEDWGDCLYLQTAVKHQEFKKHKVEIKLIETSPEDVVPFYLVSVIGSY